MESFLKTMLGFGDRVIPENAEMSFDWGTQLGGLWLFVFIGGVALLVWGVFWLYRREIQSSPRPLRIALAVVRSLVIVLLAVVLMQPLLNITEKIELPPTVVLLVDDSASIAVQNSYLEEDAAIRLTRFLNTNVAEIRSMRPSGAQIIEELASKEDKKFLRELAAKGNVVVRTFASRSSRYPLAMPQPVSVEEGAADEVAADPENDGEIDANLKKELKIDGSGTSTNLARAIRDVLNDPETQRLQAIIVLSDGQRTEGEDPRGVAEEAGQRGVPIYTIGVGDPSQPQNIRVADVSSRERVWKDDPFEIKARIASSGINNAQVRVSLEMLPQGSDSGRVVERRNVTIRGDSGETTISFSQQPQEKGEFRYVVTAERADGQPDSLPEDNSGSTNVEVIDKKIRVLLLAGSPSFEYRSLRMLLQRDQTIDLSCWLQTMDPKMHQEGNTVIDTLPMTYEPQAQGDLDAGERKPSGLSDFDVIIMIDPNPEPGDPRNEFIFPRWNESLERFVSEGGGLIYMAGPKYTASFLTDQRTNGVLPILPVNIDDPKAEERKFVSMDIAREFETEWPLHLTADGADHPITRFHSDPNENRAIWGLLPGVYWSFPGDRTKPGFTTLIEHSDPRYRDQRGGRPLLVAGRYRNGRTIYIGIHSTVRWRALGPKALLYDKFWIQSIRYVMEGKLSGGDKRGRIMLDRKKYNLGQRVQIKAELKQDDRVSPLTTPEVTGMISVEHNGQVQSFPVTLKSLALQQSDPKIREQFEGQYEGSVNAQFIGLNTLTINLDGFGGKAQIEAQFDVEIPQVEIANPRLDKTQLTQISNASGGKYFEIDEAMNLFGDLATSTEIRANPLNPVPLWDSPLVLILLVTLLTVEWALRKAYRLL